MALICRNCGNRGFIRTPDEKVSDLTLWHCHCCGYSAQEDERQETTCPQCSNKTFILLQDDSDEYRYCRLCLFASGHRFAGSPQSGESVFSARLAESPWWQILLRFIAGGAVIGLIGWLVFDRDLSSYRLILWAAGGAALCGLFALPPFQKSLLKEIRIRPEGFTVVLKGGTTDYAWADLQAARFQDYPIVSLGTRIRCLRFRTGRKNVEVSLEGLDAPTRREFYVTAAAYIRLHRIPQHSSEMPTFQNILSRTAAWVFVVGGFGMLAAHFFAYHTLGTIFGSAVMLTGTVMAFIARKERLSRWLLAATAVLVVGLIAVIWVFDISVRQVLLQWEQRERCLGRPPWKSSDPNVPVSHKPSTIVEVTHYENNRCFAHCITGLVHLSAHSTRQLPAGPTACRADCGPIS